MKKLLGITLITSLLFGMLLAGCAKKEEAPVTEAATEAPTEAPATAAAALKIECGTYVLPAEEEIEGQKVDTSEYLALMDGCNGLYRAQDDVKLNWDGKNITLEDDTKMTVEPAEGGNILVTKDGVSAVYQRTMDAPDDFDQKVQEMLVSVDYAGTYVNENQDTVTLTKKSDGTYDVVVSIVRLCQMEGDGNNVDGAIEMGLKDPNNGDMYLNFHPNMGTYDLIVTQSTWELLPAQSEITGFKKQ